MGQLLDYRQDQRWTGPQLIVVETEVTRADDLRLPLLETVHQRVDHHIGDDLRNRAGEAGHVDVLLAVDLDLDRLALQLRRVFAQGLELGSAEG